MTPGRLHSELVIIEINLKFIDETEDSHNRKDNINDEICVRASIQPNRENTYLYQSGVNNPREPYLLYINGYIEVNVGDKVTITNPGETTPTSYVIGTVRLPRNSFHKTTVLGIRELPDESYLESVQERDNNREESYNDNHGTDKPAASYM